MIVHGGNTRLQILKDLYEETQDVKFQNLQCRYVTWESESDALIGHLIENDARGDYRFIDRAIGIINAKKELEAETGKTLSSRKLITALKDLGYKLSRADLFRMSYAVNILYPIIPYALDSNLGPWQIDAIKKLDKYALGLFLEIEDNNATPEEWQEKFQQILSQHNSAECSYDEIFEDVLLALANNNSTEANRLSFILSARLEGLDPQTTPSLESDHPINKNGALSVDEGTANDKSTLNETPANTNIASSENTNTSSTPSNTTENTSPTENDNKITTPPKIKANTKNTNDPSDFTPSLEAFSKEKLSASALRDRIFSLALKLASDNGLGGLIIPLPTLGAGFIVKDLPSKNYMEGEKLYGNINNRPYKERIMVWWMLFGFSELRIMSINNPMGVKPLLPDNDLKRALFNNKSNIQEKIHLTLMHIFNRTGEFIIDDLMVHFWAVASDSNLSQMLELQQLYRQLNGVLDFNLWEMKT